MNNKLNLWVAINEDFSSYPIQLSCKAKNFNSIKKLFKKHEIEYVLIDIVNSINDKKVLMYFSDDGIIFDESTDESIMVLNIDEENYIKLKTIGFKNENIY